MSDNINEVVSQTPQPQTPPTEVVVMPRKNLREAVEDVFYNLGGTDGMITWVKESTANRRIFYKDILPKLIPKQMIAEFSGPQGGPMRMVVEWAEDNGRDMTQPVNAVMSAITQAVSDDE